MTESTNPAEATSAPLTPRAKFDLQLELLLQKDHPRVMNLEEPIPEDYPWEEFLHRHFSRPPFALEKSDYEWIVQAKSKTLKLRDSRKPTTFHSLLRFLEYFRDMLMRLERNLSLIEQQHDRLKEAAREQVGLRTLLRKKWDYDAIANKHDIMHDALKEKERLESIRHKLESLIADNLNVTSRWQFLIEPFYHASIRFINSHFEDGVFNLRRFYPVRSMEVLLAPHYTEAMDLAIDLAEAVEQTTEFLARNRRPNVARVGK